MEGRAGLIWGGVLGLIVVLMVSSLAFSRWETERFVERSRRIGAAEERLAGLATVLSTMQDAETGQRGFLLTGLDGYLEPYERARGRLEGDLDALEALYAQKPYLHSTITEIRRLSERRMAELAWTVGLRRQGFEAARSMVMSHAGKALMDQLRQWIHALSTAEGLGIARAEREFAAQTRRTDLAFLVTSLAIGLSTAGLLLFSLREMRAARRASERLAHAATHDPLTGLANRRALLEALDRALADSGATGDRPALFFMDLDGFKLVNDALGHEAGDRLLVSVAQSLRAIAHDPDLVARLGGDEFALLIRHFPTLDLAPRIVARLKATVVQANIHGPGFPVSASVGFARFPDHAASASALLRAADQGMYADKAAARSGRAGAEGAGLAEASPGSVLRRTA